jgi:hypothetical protein
MALLELSITNTAVKHEELEGSNHSSRPKKVDLGGEIASIDAGADTITFSEAILDHLDLKVDAPLEIISENTAAGSYTIQSIDSDTELTVNEDLTGAVDAGDKARIYVPVDLTLPPELGGKTIPALGSDTVLVDLNRLRKQVLNGKPIEVNLLQGLIDHGKAAITAAVKHVDVHNSIEDILERAVADLESLQGGATIANGDTSVSVAFDADLPDADYEVQLTAKSALGTALKVWASNLAVGGFDINVDANPGADVDFSWAVNRN